MNLLDYVTLFFTTFFIASSARYSVTTAMVGSTQSHEPQRVA
jgi:hypothetical protein